MKNILAVKVLLLVFCYGLYSQETMNVRSMTISQSAAGLTSFSLSAVNSNGQQVGRSFGDSGALTGYSAYNCNPCSLPQVLTTNGFGELGFRANLGQNEGHVIVTFSNPPSSDNIYIRPLILRKRTNLQFRGTTRLSIGKIEITDRFGQVIFVDNDVILEGGFIANFWQNGSNFSRRMFGFQNITFNFDEPRN